MARTCYHCPACQYTGPAEWRAHFPYGSVVASDEWPVCAECGAELARRDRLDAGQRPCEVCEHAIGAAGTSICYACQVAGAIDARLCESRALRAVTEQTIAVIRDFTLTPFRQVSP